MVFNITSIKRRSRRSAGLTLVETLVTMGIASILLLVIGALSLYSGRSFAAMANYIDLDQASRHALDRITRDIRQVIELTDFSSTELAFLDHDGGTLRFVYSPANKTLTRLKDGNAEILLRECDILEFHIFQRNPVGGSYDQYPTATPATAKLVQLNWTCSRRIFGHRINTESVQTAKVVIRNQ